MSTDVNQPVSAYATMSATYSPEDNKLRLSSVSRLDAETYQRVKQAGFSWAPKQGVFVAPMWTPAREDLLIKLCGDIGDEDTTLVDRAEQRADRFSDYSDKRADDAEHARRAVDAVAKRFEFGQPILVGHHSERRARKDQERIDNGMRKAVRMWDTAQYWKSRAAGALQHAKYKERPDVRHRRIKKLEADKRKQQRTLDQAQQFTAQWNCDGLTYERALAITNHDYVSMCFPAAQYPKSTYEGSQSLWSALDKEIITAEQARDIAIRAHARTIVWSQRWLEHYSNRLDYERAMLGEAGGLAADKFNIEIGGRVLCRGEWLIVLRVNRKDGLICSVTTSSRYVSVKGIEEIKDYRAPEAGDAEKVKAVTKLPPLANFPGDGFLEMTGAEWKRKPNDYKCTRVSEATAEHASYRYRVTLAPGGGYRWAQVYMTDVKRTDPPPAPPYPAEPVKLERVFAPPTATVSRSAPAPTEFDAMREQLKHGVQVVNAPQLFPTPAALAARMVELADLQRGEAVLEPSAGTGVLLQAIHQDTWVTNSFCVVRTAVEINCTLCDYLRRQHAGAEVIQADFLQWNTERTKTYDCIIMNPPFVQAQDIDHIQHAVTMLRPGGRLVAICANGPRQNDKLKPVIEDNGGRWEVLPADTFKDAGTGVRTVLLTYTAPAAD